MVLCDRCKKELSYEERKNATTRITHYHPTGCRTDEYVDLCSECKRLRNEFLDKLDSYFMIDKDPMKILEGKVYWSKKTTE